MSATGLEVFDTTLQKTNVWLDEVMEEPALQSRQNAYQALRAVLQTLRDRITAEEGAHLSAQLPLLVRGIYYEGWHPANKPLSGNRDEFLKLVGERYAGNPKVAPEAMVRAVFQVLSRHITGELEHAKANLPDDIRALFD